MDTVTDTAVRQLLDREEIARLVGRLGVALDEGRFEDMRALLAEDATVRTPGGTSEGRDAVVAQAALNHPVDQPIQHVITNLVVDLDDGRARARANLVVYFGPLDGGAEAGLPAPPVEYTTGEVYRFDLARTADGWRFTGIEARPLWRSGTPFRPAPPG
jgi:hypothetical protein